MWLVSINKIDFYTTKLGFSLKPKQNVPSPRFMVYAVQIYILDANVDPTMIMEAIF